MAIFRRSSTSRGISKIPENNIFRNDTETTTEPPDDTDPPAPAPIPVCTRNPIIVAASTVAANSLDFSSADNSQYYPLGVL